MAKKKSKTPTEPLSSRLMSFAVMGYLACIQYAQNESGEGDSHALMTVEDMCKALQLDKEVAHAMDPFLEVVCKQLGHELKTVAVADGGKGVH